MRHIFWVSLVFLVAFAPTGWASSVRQAPLQIVIDAVRSANGSVHIAIWDTAEDFTHSDKALFKMDLPAQEGQVVFEVPDLPPGHYALASYHDENGNGHFDRTWIGLPNEGLAFSNGAWISLGPPTFNAAAVEIDEATEAVRLNLRY